MMKKYSSTKRSVAILLPEVPTLVPILVASLSRLIIVTNSVLKSISGLFSYYHRNLNTAAILRVRFFMLKKLENGLRVPEARYLNNPTSAKRSGVQCGVTAAAARRWRVEDTLLSARRVVACLWHADFRRAFHPTLRPVGLSMGLLELRAFSTLCISRFQIEKLKDCYTYL